MLGSVIKARLQFRYFTWGSVTRLDNLLDFESPFQAFDNN